MSRGVINPKHAFEWTYERSPSAVEPSVRRTHRVLMIDDDPIMRKLILEMLGNRYEVLTSSNGLELPRLMTEFVPNLVLLDVMMPGKNGYEVCNEIKSGEKTRSIPVIMFTAKAEQKTRLKTNAGFIAADGYIMKPFEPDQLLKKIKKFIG